MENEVVKLVKTGDVYVLTMRAGENRFNPTFVARFNEALDYIERQKGAAALITTGEGKFFSNGLDLNWMAANKAGAMQNVVEVQKLFARVLTFPIPTVAAINGHAYAGGAMLALAHDYRVMRQDRGFFCLPEIDLGIPFTPGMNSLIVSKLSHTIFVRDALFFGAKFDGREAHTKQFVDMAVPGDDTVIKTALDLAQQQAGKGAKRWVLGSIKQERYRVEVDQLLNGGFGQGGVALEKAFSKM
jgi:enoyl-CoA hydratase/carnithine racemase